MKRDANIGEYASALPARAQTYAKGDRVRIVSGNRAGATGTVSYANDSQTGYWVTVRLDGEDSSLFRASELARVESLF